MPSGPKSIYLYARVRAGGGWGVRGEGGTIGIVHAENPVAKDHRAVWVGLRLGCVEARQARSALRRLRIDSERLSGPGLDSYTPRPSQALRIDPRASEGSEQFGLFICWRQTPPEA